MPIYYNNAYVVAVLIFLSFVIIFFKILFQQRRRHNVHRITHPNEPSLDEAFTARHWDELRWIMQLGPHLFAHQGVSSLQPTTTREELHQKRKVYVRDSLVRKKVIIEKPRSATPKAKTKTMDEKEEAKLPRIRRLKSDLVLPRTKSIQGSEDDETYKQICSICLKEYLMDEEIAWSNNSDCNHMFHLACIEEWLLRHDECPCCRQNYLGPLSQNCDHDLPRQPSVPPLVASMHSISLSQDPDFLGMIASIDAMYRRAHARLLYEDSVENHGHSEGDDGLSPSLSQSNTTLSSHFAGLESPMASESHEGRNSSSVDQSRAGWSPSSNEDNI